MSLGGRRQLWIAVGMAAALAIAGCSSGSGSGARSKYPSHSITFIVPYAAGGGTGIAARLVADSLQKELNESVVVKNVATAGGQVGASQLAKAKPDGYTIGMLPIPAIMSVYTDPTRKADFNASSFTSIANHDSDPIAVAVSAKSPYQTLNDVLAAARERPGKMIASGGTYLAAGHLSILSLAKTAGVQFAIQLYDDLGKQRAALLGGNVTLEFGSLAELAPDHLAGTNRIIAVFDTQSPKQSGLTNIPTAQSQGVDVILQTNRTIVVPAGTPADVVATLDAAIKRSMATQEHLDAAAKVGMALNYLDHEQTAKLWQDLGTRVEPLVKSLRGGSS